jgi:hypothetical protein
MESRSLLTATKSGWNCSKTMLKNNVTAAYISLCLQLVHKYCLYFLNYLRSYPTQKRELHRPSLWTIYGHQMPKCKAGIVECTMDMQQAALPVLVWSIHFSLLQNAQAGSRTHSAYVIRGSWGAFSGNKMTRTWSWARTSTKCQG